MKKSGFTGFLKIVGFSYAIFGPFIPILFPNLLSKYPLIAFALTPSWVALVGKILYDNSAKFYFWFTRAYMLITNTEVEWSLNVVLQDVHSEDDIVSKIFEDIVHTYSDAKIWHADDHRKIIELPSLGCNIRLEEKLVGDSLDNEEIELFFSISELVVPFRKSEYISEQVILLINNILLQRVSTNKQKYTLRIKFGKNNPYFGLFVRKLRVSDQNSINFHIEFNESVGHKEEKIQVSTDYVTLVTQNLTNLQVLAKRYVTLATIDLANS